MCWVALGFCILGGASILVVAAGFALHARSLIGLRVDLHENGFRVFTRRSFEDVNWDEIATVQEIFTYDRPPILTYPANLIMPKLASKSYIAFLKCGRQHDFDGDSIKAIDRFGRLLREYSARASVSWETAESHT